jgi:UDP-N-acetylmuramyl pentapeptide phosphotransferase/UDP-N-acetylglucosamine-1-phosphate transferase
MMGLTPGSAGLLAAAAGLTAWVVAGAMTALARRRQWLDRPNDRSLHTQPTPRLGGIGIVAGVGVAGAAGELVAAPPAFPWPLLLIGAGVAAVSLIDDLRGLPPALRFGVHLAAAGAALLVYGAVDAVALGPGGAIALGWLAAPLTALWIVGFVNAFNFMDGIDGIAGGQAVVAGLAWLVIGSTTGQPTPAALGAAVAAAALGFLVHNWSPARTFMGDVGSAFLGFLLATAPLLTRSRPACAVPAVLVVWPFVFDTTVTLLRRLSRGENVFAAHRTHLYQRLTQSGWPHARVAALYMALAAGGAVLAVPIARGAISAWLGLAVAGAAAAGLWGFVTRRERRLDGTDRI